MSSMITAVVNPHSANGTTGREWGRMADILRRVAGDFAWEFTPGPDTAQGLVRSALRRGSDTIVAVGGDGTLNEVVNGFFEDGRPVNPLAALAVISRGTGSDFIKTAGIPKDIERAAEVIAKRKTRQVDVGRASFLNHSGAKAGRYFLNIADFGIGGETVARVNRTTKIFGGFVSFLWGTGMTALRWKNKTVRIRIDDGPEEEKVIQNVVMANGQYFGGGMWVAPRAGIDDGFFDIVIFGDVTRGDFLRHGRRIYSGTHLDLEKVSWRRAKKLTASSSDRVLIDMDGEQPGTLPASFEILPGALPLIVPP